MISPKAIFAVVLAVALFAGPASAQTSPTQSGDERVAALEQLVESQETLIGQQQTLIGEQEALLNAYRCMFKIDVEAVPGGCPDPGPGPELSEAEAADAALLCAGWRDEVGDTQRILTRWTDVARQLESGTLVLNEWTVRHATDLVTGYGNRVTAILPTLQSEPLTGLMTAVAGDIQTVTDLLTEGASADEIATALYTAIDRTREVDAVFARICA